MADEQQIHFGPFRLDLLNQQLWRGDQQLALQPKPLAVLHYLAARPGRLVPKAELLAQVWAGTSVTPRSLPVSINMVRKVLGETAHAPQYIATQGQYGYRFIGAVSTQPADAGVSVELPASPAWPQLVVGRAQALAELQRCWAQAQRGQAQFVFIAGEAGIGKTTLVQWFLHNMAPRAPFQLGTGQCVQHHGAGEAYLPVLAALGQIGQQAGTAVSAVLQQCAPSWWVQLPALIPIEERSAAQQATLGVRRERMLRELADALEALTVETPLVLIVEDLQWSDASTVDVLAYLAHRPLQARLLVLGTYRPSEVITHQHPLREVVQELRGHARCQDLALELLTSGQVGDYLSRRFVSQIVSQELSTLLHQRTDGNPLFMATLVDQLVQQGIFSAQGEPGSQLAGIEEGLHEIPGRVQYLLEKQIEALSAADQRLLEVASVVGREFSAAVLAAAGPAPLEQVEAQCQGLVRTKRLIEARGIEEWPDGTLSARYQFRHDLYQEVLMERLGAGQRLRLHRLIGECLEGGYAGQTDELASKMAHHFEAGRVYTKALEYRQQAAEQALLWNGYQEAVLHSTHGLELLQQVPDSPERKRAELGLRMLLSGAVMAVESVASIGNEANLQRALELSQELGETATQAAALTALGQFPFLRADRATTSEVAAQASRFLESDESDDHLSLPLRSLLGVFAFLQGAPERSLVYHRQFLRRYEAQAHRSLVLSAGGDWVVVTLIVSSWRAWMSGWPDQAQAYLERGIASTEQYTHAYTVNVALNYAVFTRLFQREPDAAQRQLQHSLALAHENGFMMFERMGAVLQGCIGVQHGEPAEGGARLSEALAAYRASGIQVFVPFFLGFLAEGYGQLGRPADGLQAVSEALGLTATNLDVFWEAELYRLKGELLLLNDERRMQNDERKTKGKKRKTSPIHRSSFIIHRSEEAEACFQQAIEVARQQGAKALELRAVMSLSRLWQQQGKTAAASKALAEIYTGFTEGFDTKDLQEAQALLEELKG